MSALDPRELGSAPLRLAPVPAPAPGHPAGRVLAGVYVIMDSLVLLAASSLASVVYFHTLAGEVSFGWWRSAAYVPALELVAVWLPLLGLYGLYEGGLSWGSGEFSKAMHAVGIGTAGYVLLRFTLALGMPPRMWVVYATVFGSVALVTERLAARRLTSRLHARGRLLRRTLVVGTNSEAASVVHALNTRRLDGFQPIGCLASSVKDRLSLDYTAPVLPTLGTARELTPIILEHEIDTVVLVASAFDHEVLERIIAELADANVDVYLSSSLADVLLSRVTVREVAGIPLISLRRISLSPANLFVKRVFDLTGALAIILAGLPLWLAVAAVIKLTSPGPVFYRQRRVGLRGKPFRMYKFRTMVEGADAQLAKVQRERNVEAGPLFKLRDDPRITPVGKWMRRFSIDEFPQLLNVVRGEMSLVGPRPPLPDETLYYDECQWRRLEVVPGMTGLWQVSGRSRLTFEEMVELDLFYIGNWRLALDLSILARTVPAVLGAQGAW